MQAVHDISQVKGARTRLSDVKPYSVPRSLDDLRGPSSGTITLPKALLWAPGGGDVPLSTRGNVKLAYQAIISEGTVEQQCRYLNKALLTSVWPHLSVPAQAARQWQERFPELRGNLRAKLAAC